MQVNPHDESHPAAESVAAVAPAASLLSLPLWSEPAVRDARTNAERPSLLGLHIDDLLREVVERRASDLHLSEGLPPMIRMDGRLVRLEYDELNGGDIQ